MNTKNNVASSESDKTSQQLINKSDENNNEHQADIERSKCCGRREFYQSMR